MIGGGPVVLQSAELCIALHTVAGHTIVYHSRATVDALFDSVTFWLH
jgi:hypothetical protein